MPTKPPAPTTPKIGRPFTYKPEFNAEAQKLCMLGATNVQLADFFKVSKQTIDQWRTRYPEFFEAMRRGKALADANVATALYKRATGYKHKAVKIFMPAGHDEPVYAPYVEHYPPDTQAATFWLTNRAPDQWKNKQEVNAVVRTVESLSDEQLAALDLALELVPDGAGGFKVEGEEK